jgi:hypothetical protein
MQASGRWSAHHAQTNYPAVMKAYGRVPARGRRSARLICRAFVSNIAFHPQLIDVPVQGQVR